VQKCTGAWFPAFFNFGATLATFFRFLLSLIRISGNYDNMADNRELRFPDTQGLGGKVHGDLAIIAGLKIWEITGMMLTRGE
jgi:hypothetical protein